MTLHYMCKLIGDMNLNKVSIWFNYLSLKYTICDGITEVFIPWRAAERDKA